MSPPRCACPARSDHVWRQAEWRRDYAAPPFLRCRHVLNMVTPPKLTCPPCNHRRWVFWLSCAGALSADLNNYGRALDGSSKSRMQAAVAFSWLTWWVLNTP